MIALDASSLRTTRASSLNYQKRKGEECPVTEKYKQSHDICDFKTTQEELSEDLEDREKYYCPHHGWVAGWIIQRPVAGSSAPLYRFCPIKGCNYRRRGT